VIGSGDIATLLRMDFGTDKRIGYMFFNNTNDVDDTFYNSLVARSMWPSDLVTLQIDSARTSRKEFGNLETKERNTILSNVDQHASTDSLFVVKEIEDRVQLIQLPHLEWNSIFKNLNNFFYYR